MTKNILITSVGRRVSLVNFFKKELQIALPKSKVFTTDLNPEISSACRVSDKFFKVPRVTNEDYISILLDISLKNDIKLIIPTIDTELLVLSKNKQLFNNNGIEIVISDNEIIQIFRDKRKTHDFFEKYKINIAKEFTKQNYKLPLYIKPIDGSRSVDNYIITDKNALTDYHFKNDKLMFLEYLDHKKHVEFTIDLYYDKKSELKCLIPRKRIEVRDGEVSKALTIEAKFIPEISKKLNYIDGFRGCVTLQIFENIDNNSIFGIEINPRFGGGYPLSYLAGGNFIKWIIDEYLLDKNVAVFDSWEKNLLMLRYDNEVLVHNF